MNKIDFVIQKLNQQNINPSVKSEYLNNELWNEINWVNNSGDQFSIYENNIDIEGDKVSWFQSNGYDKHTLIIYENNSFFTWTPKTYNPIFGCFCLLLEWYKNHLIFIYQEKHDIYICSVQNKNVKYFNFNGEEIERSNDLISYETYSNKSDLVKIIQIPELVSLPSLNRKEAEKLSLIPTGLNRPGNFLSRK
ncbi:hypothetical protein [Emticicia oligotrophica]|uniref:hypothetical protein n=1 Tax=Emticicia oligotrophica TaxID=312279 RepID=UPI00273BDC33|nr:hypothetical protein [Emticicia oligotrophica]